MSSSRSRKHAKKKQEAAGNAVYTVVKIVVVVLIVMVIYRLGSMAYTYGERIFGEPAMAEAPGTDISITVEETDSVRDVAGVRLRLQPLEGRQPRFVPGLYARLHKLQIFLPLEHARVDKRFIQIPRHLLLRLSSARGEAQADTQQQGRSKMRHSISFHILTIIIILNRQYAE